MSGTICDRRKFLKLNIKGQNQKNGKSMYQIYENLRSCIDNWMCKDHILKAPLVEQKKKSIHKFSSLNHSNSNQPVESAPKTRKEDEGGNTSSGKQEMCARSMLDSDDSRLKQDRL